MTKRLRGSWVLMMVAVCLTAGCELVADFDRDKIPEPPHDAATIDKMFNDAGASDAGASDAGASDAGASDAAASADGSVTQDSGAQDEDAGR